MMNRLIIAILILICGWTSLLDAQSQSAADAYRAAARGISATTQESEHFVMLDVLDAPLDRPAQNIVERFGKSLDLFDVASKMPFGTWGYDLNEPMTAGRVVPGILELSDFVMLRARLRSAAGDRSAVLNDAYQLILLSRRMGVEPSLPRQMQQMAIFDKATHLAGLGLLDASPDDLKHFSDQLDELRSPPDAIDVIESQERAYLLYHHKLLEDPYLRRIANEGIGPFNMLFGATIKPVDVSDIVFDEDASAAAFAATEQAFSDVIAALRLSPTERIPDMQAARAKVRAAHPLAQAAMEMIDQCVRLSQIHDMQMTFLRTAVQICSDPQRPLDMDKARALARPQRFDLTPTDSGFIMKWTDQGQLNPPMVIQVGKRPMRVNPTTFPTPAGSGRG